MRALFFEFPQESELLAVDRQFMLGSDILVTPVLTPNVTSVSGEHLHGVLPLQTQRKILFTQVFFPVADRSSGVTGTPTPS
jgi:Glycosyl hydrolases family 31